MKGPLRQLLAIAALPFVVAVVIPVWLARRYDGATRSDFTDIRVLEATVGISGVIAGVFLVLIGQALFLGSVPHALWVLTFFAINAVYIPLVEEPQLRRRFGASYAEYCKHVPRLIPRLRPWQPVPLQPIQ